MPCTAKQCGVFLTMTKKKKNGMIVKKQCLMKQGVSVGCKLYKGCIYKKINKNHSYSRIKTAFQYILCKRGETNVPRLYSLQIEFYTLRNMGNVLHYGHQMELRSILCSYSAPSSGHNAIPSIYTFFNDE